MAIKQSTLKPVLQGDKLVQVWRIYQVFGMIPKGK